MLYTPKLDIYRGKQNIIPHTKVLQIVIRVLHLSTFRFLICSNSFIFYEVFTKKLSAKVKQIEINCVAKKLDGGSLYFLKFLHPRYWRDLKVNFSSFAWQPFKSYLKGFLNLNLIQLQLQFRNYSVWSFVF